MVSPAGKTPGRQMAGEARATSTRRTTSRTPTRMPRSVDSPCDADTDADDTVLHLGGHVGDNEGSHFWGFEFMKNAPGGFTNLKANDGSSFNLDFNRVVGDILVSFTVPGNSSEPVQLELFRVTGFNGDGSAIFSPVAALPGCPASAPQGLQPADVEQPNQVEAPPWNIPVCDPTADNGANTCRLANGTTNAEDLLAERDFAEASIDLQAFGINPCFSNVVFSAARRIRWRGPTSRTSVAPTSRSAGRRRGSSSTTATPTGTRTPVTRVWRTGTSSSTATRRRQGPRGHRRRHDRQRRDVDRHRRRRTPAGPTSSPTSRTATTSSARSSRPAGTSHCRTPARADKADCSVDTTLGAVGRASRWPARTTSATTSGTTRTRRSRARSSRTRTATGSGTPVSRESRACRSTCSGQTGSAMPSTAPDHGCQRELLDLGAAGQLHGVRDGADGLHAVVPDLGTDCAGRLHHAAAGRLRRSHWPRVERTRQRLRELPNGTKSGTKFEDLNANGVRDAGEPGRRGRRDPPVRNRRAGQPPCTCTRPRRRTARTRSRHRRAATRRARRCRPATRSRSRPPGRAARGPHAAPSGHRLAVTLTSGSGRLRQRLRELQARHDQWHEVQGCRCRRRQGRH